MRTVFPWAALAGFVFVGACLAADPARGVAGAAAKGAPPFDNAPGAGGAPGAPGAPGVARGALAPDMRALIAEYASDSASVRDFYTIDRSPTRLDREDALDAAWLARLDALDFESLDPAARIDWLLLRNELRHADRQRAATRGKLEETAPLLSFADEIAALEEARWRLEPVDPEAAATHLDALAKAIKAMKERVEKGKAVKADADSPPHDVQVRAESRGVTAVEARDGAAVDSATLLTFPRRPSYGMLLWGRGDNLRTANDGAAGSAVAAALDWLAKHQDATTGSWSSDGLGAQCAAHGGPACGGVADPQRDVAVTSLALLAFLGNGSSDKTGPHHAAVKRGLRQLIAWQAADGSFAAAGQAAHAFDQVVATLAMLEAHIMTMNHLFKSPAEHALQFLTSSRVPGAAWVDATASADGPELIGDVSLSSLALMTMAIARDAGKPDALAPPDFNEALAALDSWTPAASGQSEPMSRDLQPARGAAAPRVVERDVLRSTSALLARQLAALYGPQADSGERNQRAIDDLLALTPTVDMTQPGLHDIATWFFGAHALFQVGDARQSPWWKALVDTATRLQQTDDGARGSWDPGANPDEVLLGRAGTTALVALSLEAPWRYTTAKEAIAKALAQEVEAQSTPRHEHVLEAAPAVHTAVSPAAAKGDGATAADAPLSVTPVVAQRAARELHGLRQALDTWFAHYDQFSPGFAWWARKPYDAAGTALNEYATLLREDIAGLKGKDEDPLVGDPIGREALLDDLAAEMIDYSPEELLAIGEREFAWCEAQMKLAAAEMGFGDDWKAALDRVKSEHVEPGEQDRLVTEQSKEAIAFLDARDLVTIPELCRETWRVRMIDADTQRTLPYAAYGGQDMLVAYPTRDMDQETKLMTMRGNNVHFSRIVVPHELIPGHHLQGFMAARSNTQRDRFGTPFLGEGWALYWEMRLWELGWPRGPEDRIGMLFWRMHRAARIIVSLNFHLGQMQPQQMIDFLVERVGHEKAGATSEVRRYVGGSYGPLYQCAYMIGGLQLRALHDELVSANGGRVNPATGSRWTERAFHDAVLAQNSMPVKLIRAALLAGGDGPALSRDGPPAWRFAGDP